MNRRQFITSCAGAAGALVLPNHLHAAGGSTAKLHSDRVKLGPRQVELSRMAFGTGTSGWGGSSNQTRKLGLKGLARCLEEAVDNGITFFDCADMYGSHPHVKEALKGLSRDKVTIMTKSTASTAEAMRNDIDRFRRELGVDHIDILLLHCMTDDDWNVKRRGAMDAIDEAQQKGIIRTKGTSCHTLGALKTAAAEPWVEVDLARLNPKQVAMDAAPDVVIPILKQMKAQGKGVLGMKVFGAGKMRDQQDAMLKYTLSQDCIDAFTIGMESSAEMQDCVRRITAAARA
jgi:aryl-alcohol dehydrogenase-like predicted oxidoreductase